MKAVCIRIAFFVLASVTVVLAQETINYASISGRVTDPSGAVVVGAHVTTRHGDTNIKCVVTTDREGWFRVPYLKVGGYQITVHQDGFADFARTVTLSVGSAFELPITLAVAERRDVRDRQRGRRGSGGGAQPDRRHRVADRSPQPAAQRPQFSRPRAAGSRRLAHQHRQQSALRRNLRRAGPGHLRRQPAQFLQQLHRRRPLRQRRRRRPERHLLRSRRGARISGGHLRRPGRVRAARSAATSTWSPRAAPTRCTATSTATSAISASTRPIRSPTPSCPSTQAQYGASLGGPIVRDRTFYFANFEQRELNQSGLITIAPANVAAINARLAAVGYPGRRSSHRPLSQSGAQHQFPRQSRSSVQHTAISSASATASTTSTAATRAAPAG